MYNTVYITCLYIIIIKLFETCVSYNYNFLFLAKIRLATPKLASRNDKNIINNFQ